MVWLGVLTQVGIAGKNFPASSANKFMGVPNMIVTVFLLYKAFFALGTLNFLVSSIYMHITLSYVLKMSITVFTHHLVVLAISF